MNYAEKMDQNCNRLNPLAPFEKKNADVKQRLEKY